MLLKKFSRFMIELPDGSRTQKTFRTRAGAQRFKKKKKIYEGRVIKVTFSSMS